mmetsp:Transcript_11514/g.29143  ORF Transcript_11514/g.29143 Transcript_11514/m.29143 type:complete len:287 (+) Transcript_11514:102-962(+)
MRASAAAGSIIFKLTRDRQVSDCSKHADEYHHEQQHDEDGDAVANRPVVRLGRLGRRRHLCGRFVRAVYYETRSREEARESFPAREARDDAAGRRADAHVRSRAPSDDVPVVDRQRLTGREFDRLERTVSVYCKFPSPSRAKHEESRLRHDGRDDVLELHVRFHVDGRFVREVRACDKQHVLSVVDSHDDDSSRFFGCKNHLVDGSRGWSRCSPRLHEERLSSDDASEERGQQTSLRLSFELYVSPPAHGGVAFAVHAVVERRHGDAQGCGRAGGAMEHLERRRHG